MAGKVALLEWIEAQWSHSEQLHLDEFRAVVAAAERLGLQPPLLRGKPS